MWHFSFLQNLAKCKGFPLCHRLVRKSTDGSLTAQSKLWRSKTLVKCCRNIGPALHSFITAFPMLALSWERSLGPLTLDLSHLKAVSKLFWTSPTWIELLEIDLWHFISFRTWLSVWLPPLSPSSTKVNRWLSDGSIQTREIQNPCEMPSEHRSCPPLFHNSVPNISSKLGTLSRPLDLRSVSFKGCFKIVLDLPDLD